MVRDVLFTPGDTEPKEAFCASLIDACVRFHVTGNENASPAFSGPCGREAFEAWKVGSRVVSPLTLVIAMSAVQLTVTVAVEPTLTSPKLTG